MKNTKPLLRLLAAHQAMIDGGNHYAYFELAYTRQTGWMAWICSKPREIDPNRKILAQGQGSTVEQACTAAIESMETCPECGCSPPGHKILCKTGNDRAEKYQRQLSAKHVAGRRGIKRPKPLTYPQQGALQQLEKGEWKTAAKMQLPFATLRALEKLGRVERRQCVERITGYGTTDYEWRIKTHD